MKVIRSATTFMVTMLLLTSTLAQDTPTDEDINTCYGCAAAGQGGIDQDGTNYMCSPPESMTLKSKGGLICCQPGVNDSRSYCNREKTPACTQAFNEVPNKWRLACPQATKENCGGQKVITALGETQTWGKQNMRLVMRDYTTTEKPWKTNMDNQYDMCWWVIQPEGGKWKSGNYVIKFTTKAPGIKILTYGSEAIEGGEAGLDYIQLVKKVHDMEFQPEVGVEYELDIRYDLLIQAVPSNEAQATDFEFEFKIVGEEFPYYEAGHEWLKMREDPQLIYILMSVAYCMFWVCCCGIPVGCCCMQGLKEKKAAAGNQVIDNTQVTDGANPNRQQVPGYDHQTSGQEMELESLDNQSQEKTYQPSNDAHQSQAYANPFKKQKHKGNQ